MTVWLGTAGWSYKDWIGPFYPSGTAPGDMLRSYAQRFRCVEVDSSFYSVPAKRTVEAWCKRVPMGFVFCPKFPKSISHDSFLLGCEQELTTFLERMSLLGGALGPMLLQFPYFNQKSGVDLAAFLARLEPFLDLLVEWMLPHMRVVVEVRNRSFLRESLFAALRKRKVPLALIDHAWMPSPDQQRQNKDMLTSDFVYLRLLGDRYGIEKLSKTWDRELVDQSWRISSWADWVKELAQERTVFAFANNHFAGFAPASMQKLQQALEES
ncbi:MAG: hypothetical protein CSA62_02120 [Planctomycetota bacterium]|nr:MAG: hypothetical protein CSA62_02120 [Planctomycetota bacterium]